MSTSPESEGRSYDDSYREFDSPLMRQLRVEAYGRDIGQHSWVRAEDLEEDASRLKLERSSRLLDLGCGPGGPLTFLVSMVGCAGMGVDVSAEAISAARVRAASLGLEGLVTWQQADLNERLPFASGSFDAVMSLDVILHLRDRAELFREAGRVLTPGGRFLFTDAAVVTGPISDEDVRRRAANGHIHVVPEGFNERMLEEAGFRLVECCDRTASLLKAASGRLAARQAHRQELEQVEGSSHFGRQQSYLETVVVLSQRGALARKMYLAESPAA